MLWAYLSRVTFKWSWGTLWTSFHNLAISQVWQEWRQLTTLEVWISPTLASMLQLLQIALNVDIRGKYLPSTSIWDSCTIVYQCSIGGVCLPFTSCLIVRQSYSIINCYQLHILSKFFSLLNGMNASFTFIRRPWLLEREQNLASTSQIFSNVENTCFCKHSIMSFMLTNVKWTYFGRVFIETCSNERRKGSLIEILMLPFKELRGSWGLSRISSTPTTCSNSSSKSKGYK